MKVLSIWLLSLLFLTAGTLHFLMPRPFVDIVPRYLPHPLFLVHLSGVFELAGGLGLLIPRVRPWAGGGLMVLLLCVFPANLFMLTDHPTVLGTMFPHWLLVIRLPLQFVLMFWVYWTAMGKNNGVR